MPLPFGHIAVGLATHDLCSRKTSALSRWELLIFVAVLSNLPDIDILIGLLLRDNGNAFHRGPTHSLLFALIMGFFASNAWKLSSKIPRINLKNCFLIILSHVVADFFFTNCRVSFFWPFEVNWAGGFSNWGEVLKVVFLQPFHDTEIIMGCGLVIILKRSIGRYFDGVGPALRKICEEKRLR